MMQMPFGRHKGRPLSELPLEYLEWLVTEADIHSATLRVALRAEWQQRTGHRAHHQEATHTARPCPSLSVAGKLIGAGLRALSRRYHPDAGGSHEQMIRVTAAAEWLRATVRGLPA